MLRTMVVALAVLVLAVANASAGEDKIQIKKFQIAPAPDGKVMQFQIILKDGKFEIVQVPAGGKKPAPEQIKVIVIQLKDGKPHILELQQTKQIVIQLKDGKAQIVELPKDVNPDGTIRVWQAKPGPKQPWPWQFKPGPRQPWQFKPGPRQPHEHRLKAIEEQLERLLKEVQELRKAPQPFQPPNRFRPPPFQKEKERAEAERFKARQAMQAMEKEKAKADERFKALQALQAQLQRVRQLVKADQIITLSRATYRLPKGKAEALANILKELKVSVMETRIDGDSLTVTTTPEAQQTVARLVALMQGQGQRRTIRIE